MKKVIEIFLYSLLYLIVFLASVFHPGDADLGWHLKYGEYIFNHGRILKENIFSSMMPNFIWPNISWGSDLLYYSIFSTIGFIGLSIAGALVITCTFYFFSKAYKLSLWDQVIIFPILLFLEQPVNEISFRGQLISLMLFSLQMFFLKSYERGNKKIIYGLIPLFLIWANIHGQFVLGLGVFLLWIIGYVIQQTIVLKLNGASTLIATIRPVLVVFIISILATIIHPFGISIYQDAFLHFGNPLLKYIMEYLPFTINSIFWWNQIIISLIIVLSSLYLLITKRISVYITDVVIVVVLLTLSLMVRRYTWSFYYVAIPFLIPIANFIKPDSKKMTSIAASVVIIFTSIIIFVVKSPWTQYTKMSWDIYCKNIVGCTPQSADFLVKHYSGQTILNLYSWGGWLIWNYPQVTPAIDGRMHLWEQDGYSAFSKYYAWEQNWENVDNAPYDIIYMPIEKPIYKRLKELEKAGTWKRVYEDKTAGIFERIK